jgi:CRP-like cAMP-binding protein
MFVELFANSALFKDLDSSQLEKIVRVCNVEEKRHGEYIFREGDAGDRLYLIAEGAVRISRMIRGSGEEALVVLKEGAYFGEMSLFDGEPRSTDAIVDSRCLLISITRDAFMELIESDKELAYKVLSAMVRILSERLRTSNEQLRSIMIMAMF